MKGRLHSAGFGLLCAAGAVASIGLTVHEVAKTAPVALSVRHTSRIGAATLVTIGVSNRTAVDRCVTVRVAARDRDGHDLAAAVAAPALALPPHARRTVQVRLTLTPRQYAEKLQAFYPSERPCVRQERGD
jgi:hypothetical protein